MLISNAADLSVEMVSIFDWYGNFLYQSSGPFTDRVLWDGNAFGTPVPPGVYVVQLHVRLTDQPEVMVHETVTVLR